MERKYLYTVERRVNGGWKPVKVKAADMAEVAQLLKEKLDDIRYVDKVRCLS